MDSNIGSILILGLIITDYQFINRHKSKLFFAFSLIYGIGYLSKLMNFYQLAEIFMFIGSWSIFGWNFYEAKVRRSYEKLENALVFQLILFIVMYIYIKIS